MDDSPRFRVISRRWLASQRAAHRAFRAALDRPAEVQAAGLRRIVARHASSEYGRRFGFDRIRTTREYQDAVPVLDWEAVAPWIEAIKDGRQDVLTAEPVLVFETTGSSTGGAKYIPYTAGLLEEFQRALAAWMVDLYGARPLLGAGGAYWSVSPAARARQVTRGKIPVGFSDDGEYFGRRERRALRSLLLTPPELPAVEDMDSSRYVTLRYLLGSEHLAFISVWNPSFLTLLVGALAAWTPCLIEDIERGTVTPPTPLPPALRAALERRLTPRPARARALRALLGRAGVLRPVEAWPRLQLISCWTGAGAARLLPALETAFPGVEVQGKGLLATEGVVSIPLVGHPGGPVAITSHFYEFAPVDAPEQRPRLVHEIEDGRLYTVLLTTGGGLYRYALGDIVRVVGRVEATPLVEFVGRAGIVSDLCGEKLAETHVALVLDVAVARLGVRCAFLMLAPERATLPHYALLAETRDASGPGLAELAAEVEAGLLENPSYAYCRRLGQLGAVRAFRVEGGAAAAYHRRCGGLGQRAGSIKPAALHRAPEWTAHMPGAFV